MRYPKVLVCTPTSEKKNYCEAEFLKQLKSISYPNFDVLIVDNSPTQHHSLKLCRNHRLNVLHVSPKNKPSMQFIAESYEAMRRYAIEKNYDALLTLESDVFFKTPDIIQELMKHNKLVISAIYPIRHGAASFFLLQQRFENYLPVTEPDILNLEEGSDLIFIDGTVKEVTASGLGCCLIRKEVFTKIPFRFIAGENYHNDTFFYIDLFAMRIKNFVDTALICEHKNQPWNIFGALN